MPRDSNSETALGEPPGMAYTLTITAALRGPSDEYATYRGAVETA